MRIALFGAAGWLGRAILSRSGNRAEIRAFDRGPEAWDEWRDLDDREEIVVDNHGMQYLYVAPSRQRFQPGYQGALGGGEYVYSVCKKKH